MKILHRYIYLELSKTFLLTLGLFVFVILMDRASSIAETVLGQGVSLWDFLSVLVKGIPAFLGITIPMAFVLSVLITFIQMGSNNELIAMKSCGISLKKISIPVVLLGIFLSLVSFYVTMFVMPKSNIAMKKQIEQLLKKKITMSISEKNFSSNFPGITFYTEKLYPQKGYLEDFMVSLQKKDKLITIFAKKGLLRTVKDSVFLDIQNGVAHFLDWKKPESLKILNFKSYTVKLYTFSEKEQFKAVKYKTLFQLLRKKGLEAKVEIFKRLTVSLSPFIVGILAFSIAVLIPRGSVGVGVLISLLIIVTYYVLYTVAKKTAIKVGIPVLPLIPDVLFGILAAYFYKQAIDEKLKLDIGGRW